jgi:hypothetical protein
MKKLMAATVIIGFALVIFKAPGKTKISSAEKTERKEVKLLPVSSKIQTALELREELKKAEPELQMKVAEAKKAFRKELKSFKKVTATYNEKSIDGTLNSEDEKVYKVNMEKSLKAFMTYQDLVIKELNLTKEI